jgi:hypothetical protein
MSRWMLSVVAVLAGAAAATAGPLDWTYTATFKSIADTRTILLGKETWWEFDPSTGQEKGTEYYLLLDVRKEGWTRTGTLTPGGAEELWSFGHGDWRLSESLPTEPYSDGQFVMTLAFTDPDGNVGYANPQLGRISAGGLTSGTGNFTIGLGGSQLVGVGNRYAEVTYGNRASESANRVTFQAQEAFPPEVPEPGTLILGGIAIAGGFGAWRRKA